jgi:hypothetical protein
MTADFVYRVQNAEESHKRLDGRYATFEDLCTQGDLATLDDLSKMVLKEYAIEAKLDKDT